MANYLREFATESAYTEATLNYPSVSLIDENGTVYFDQTSPTPPTPSAPRWIATYEGGTILSGECNASSAITPSEFADISYEVFDDEYSFWNYTSIEIGSCVTEIENTALSDSPNVESITINATTPPTISDYEFTETNNCPIYVPAESVDAYKSAQNWSNLASRIFAIP